MQGGGALDRPTAGVFVRTTSACELASAVAHGLAIGRRWCRVYGEPSHSVARRVQYFHAARVRQCAVLVLKFCQRQSIGQSADRRNELLDREFICQVTKANRFAA